MNTHYIDDEGGLLYRVNRVVVRKGVIVAGRWSRLERRGWKIRLQCTFRCGAETKGVDSGDRSKSGDVRDGSLQKPLEPNRESLGPANEDSIPVEGLPVDQEPRSTTKELMANPV